MDIGDLIDINSKFNQLDTTGAFAFSYLTEKDPDTEDLISIDPSSISRSQLNSTVYRDKQWAKLMGKGKVIPFNLKVMPLLGDELNCFNPRTKDIEDAYGYAVYQ